MTTSTLAARYKINGLIDTKTDVITNLEKMAQACGSYLTYDIHQGKWGVVISKTETASRSFDASNILGGIQLNGTGITNLYNSVTVEYPLRDTSDQYDSITLAVDSADRHDYEPDNELIIRNHLINEPVQATLVGLLALNQSRVDQSISFVTDYSAIDLTAGEVIAVTHDAYSFDEDEFRVISVNEVDSDDGQIVIEINAIRYYDSVYDDSNLTRYVRSDRNGIRSIGSIGQPIEPQISVYEVDSRPRVEVEATVPDGIVESMELWVSSDGVNYTRVEVETPVGGGTFSSGDVFTFDYDKLNSQDIYAKVRGMNSTTTGPFSSADSYIGYVPAVEAGAITDNTSVYDDSGNDILSLLGANGLLLLLKQFMEDDSTATGGIFEQLFGLYNTDTGVDLTSSDLVNNFGRLDSSSAAAIIAGTFSATISNIPQSTNNLDYLGAQSFSFTPAVSGNYIINTTFDQNSSAAIGGRGAAWSEVEDTIRVRVRLFQNTTQLSIAGSGGPGAFFWTDYNTTQNAYLTAGITYTLTFDFVNYTESNTSGLADFDVSCVVLGV